MSQVLILMGSDSDAPIMSAAGEVLTELGVTWEMTVASAHRSPAQARVAVKRGRDPRAGDDAGEQAHGGAAVAAVEHAARRAQAA